MRNKTQWTTAAVALLAAGGLLCGSMTMAQPQDPPPRDPPRRDAPRQGMTILRVSGSAQSQAAPDRATVRIGAVSQAEDAQAAQDQVNQIVQRAIEAIRGQGIEEQNLRTADLSLHPVYSHPQPRPGREQEPQEPQIVGYRASNTVIVDLSDLAKIGPVIDAAVGAGANQLQGIDFSLRNDLEARTAALEQAVEEARRKAESLARAAGMELGQLLELNEGGVSIEPPRPMYGMRMEMAQAASTPVQPGQLDIHASVTLVYRLDGPREGDRGAPTRPRE